MYSRYKLLLGIKLINAFLLFVYNISGKVLHLWKKNPKQLRKEKVSCFNQKLIRKKYNRFSNKSNINIYTVHSN